MQPTPMHDRVLLTSYPRYTDAQATVDRLADARFPVEEVSIVGRDLKLVEDVTGRLTYGRVALAGAVGGAWLGGLFGLFIGLFADDSRSVLALLFWGLVFGAAGGMLLAMGSHALTGGRRDFVSVSQLLAERYDVTVDARTAEDARQILAGGRTAARPDADPAPADPADPPEPAERSWRDRVVHRG